MEVNDKILNTIKKIAKKHNKSEDSVTWNEIAIELAYELEIKPVVITENLLLNLGFIPKGGYYNKDAFNVEVINDFEYIYFSIIDSDYDFEIKYVHQLQNIFYYLTGQELNMTFINQ